jgi:hypothetical protein
MSYCKKLVDSTLIKKQLSGIALVLMLFVSCCLCSCASAQNITPNSSFQFRSAKEKQETEYKARHGDAKAARRMAEYSYFIEGSRRNAIRWYKIGASYGDKVSRENVKTLSED